MKTLAIVFTVGLTACAVVASQETTYLQSAQDHATQSDVRSALGAPQKVSRTDTGDVWIYDRYSLEPGAQTTWSTSGSQCDQYTLRFDGEGVLRNWTHNNYRHGGETMPPECITPAEHWRRSSVSTGYHYMQDGEAVQSAQSSAR